MDSIYKGAILTTVAMSGEHDDAPLPGVRVNSRPPQLAVEIGKMGLISTPPSLPNMLRDSKYETRGWTFQERLLSRRCLSFSGMQVYFECLRGVNAETGNPPIKDAPKGLFTPNDPQAGNPLKEFPAKGTTKLDRVELFEKYRTLVEKVRWLEGATGFISPRQKRPELKSAVKLFVFGRQCEQNPADFDHEKSSSYEFVLLSTQSWILDFTPPSHEWDDHWGCLTLVELGAGEAFGKSFPVGSGMVNLMLIK
jgi:hypothetical protein